MIKLTDIVAYATALAIAAAIPVPGMTALAASPSAGMVSAAADAWPPFVDPDVAGKGLAIEIVRSAYESQGYEFELVLMPWARALKSVEHGKFDIIPDAWRSAERETVFAFSEAYLVNALTFIKRIEDPFEYTGFKSLAGRKVGVIRGSDYGDDFMKAETFERVAASELEQNLRRLALGRINLALADRIAASVPLRSSKYDLSTRVTFVEQPFSLTTLHVISGMSNPRSAELISAFNKGLQLLRDSGELAEILTRFGSSLDDSQSGGLL